MQDILFTWEIFFRFCVVLKFVSASFVHQVELTFIFREMKREDYVCVATAWHLCMLYLYVARMCTDLTPVYAQGMLQAGMA
jgi:hypothetical protein